MRDLLLPPLWLLLCLLGIALSPGPVLLPTTARWTGVLPVALGIGLVGAARYAYLQRGSEIHTFREPRGLITTGVFAWSRNPMYLGFLLVLVGAVLGRGSLFGLGPWLVFLLLCIGVYVPYEERAAEQAFGSAYQDYRKHTPRWFGFPSRRPS